MVDSENLRGSITFFSGFGSHPNMRRIQPPSPAFNRDPKYSEPWSQYGRIKSPGTRAAGSLEELQEREDEAEGRMRLAKQDRLRDQELERQERMRLEEILAMCAEYERQSSRPADKSTITRPQDQQNRYG
jgi:hypothetical protein